MINRKWKWVSGILQHLECNHTVPSCSQDVSLHFLRSQLKSGFDDNWWDKPFPSNGNQIRTQHLADNHPPILPRNSSSGVPLIGVLNEGVTLVDRAPYDFAILGENGLYIRLGDQQGVEVTDKDPWVEGAWVGLIGDVAAGHQAGGGGGGSSCGCATGREKQK